MTNNMKKMDPRFHEDDGWEGAHNVMWTCIFKKLNSRYSN
jgi:hypothetical protein